MKYMIVTASLLIGCQTTPKLPAKTCCQRLDVREYEMTKFNRYCKVALFLSNSENRKEVGSGVRKAARDAVNICKFVFKVDTDTELVAAGDRQEDYRASRPTEQHQVTKQLLFKECSPNGWRTPLDCDPNEPTCEEF